MKRYLVFTGERYYPEPGMGNFVGDVDTEGEAYELAKTKRVEWVVIYDTLIREDIFNDCWS